MKSLQQSHKGTKIEADRYNRTDVGSHTTWVSRHMTKVANKHQKCHWQCVNDPEFSISVFVSFFLLFQIGNFVQYCCLFYSFER